jgi:hypothetical protein
MRLSSVCGLHGDDVKHLHACMHTCLYRHASSSAHLPMCLTLCLLLRLEEYRFRISCYVYDRKRPLAPILKQSRCSLMYDVYLTCIDDDGNSCTMVQQDWNTSNTTQDQNWIFFLNNEQWTMKSKIIEWKQKSNNNKSTRYNWHTSIMHNIQ